MSKLPLPTMKYGILGLFALAALVPAARADLIYTFTQDGCSGGCGPQAGGFGTVDLQQVTADEVLVTVTLSNGNEFVKMGNHDALTFDVDGGTVTLSNFEDNSVSDGKFSQDSSPSNPPFDPFSYGVFCNGCGNGASNPVAGQLSFEVSRSTGVTFSDFVSNTSGIFFASDIISATTGNTGAVGAPDPPAVPEPGFYGLLALGLAGLFVGVRRRSALRRA